MLNGHISSILRPRDCPVRCSATVDLISRVMRPYLFKVTVKGEFPHCYTRVYEIAAVGEDSAGMTGLKLFVEEFSPQHKVLRALDS